MTVRRITEVDLSHDEQESVRAALRNLRLRFGTWDLLAHSLRIESTSLIHVGKGRRTVTPTIAFRVARLVNVSIDALLAGKFPSAFACPRCGYDPRPQRKRSAP